MNHNPLQANVDKSRHTGYKKKNVTQNGGLPSSHFITGGAGFIGSHLVDRLIADGNRVTVYDNLDSGSANNIEQHIGKNGFSFIRASLLDVETLKRAIRGHELVWHLGAHTNIPEGNENTYLDLNNCTIATYNLLEAMRQNAIRKMLFTSTSAVYGEIDKLPTSEDAGPVLPISLYGAAKLACEGLISAYCHLFDMKAWMFRFGNVLGDRMGHGVIFDFIHKLKSNPGELEILGDGKQDKNYFLVEDCIEGMFCALRNSNEQCEVYNLGCHSTVNVSTIARIVVEEMGLTDVKFRYTGGKRGWPGDVPVVHFDLAKMEKLKWRAKYSSEEAVRLATRRILGRK